MRGLVVKKFSALAIMTATIVAVFSTMPIAAAQPITLNVVGTSDTTVRLEWTKTDLPALEFGWYLIERHTNDYELFYMRLSDINATAWTDRDLHPSTGYGYKIYVCYAVSIWPTCLLYEESAYASATTQATTDYATKWELQVARSELIHALWNLQQLQSILRSDAVNETDDLWEALNSLNHTVYSLNQNLTELRWDILNITSTLRRDSADEIADDTWALQQDVSILRGDAADKTGDLHRRMGELETENSDLRTEIQFYLYLIIIILIIAVAAVSVGAVGAARSGRVSRELKELPPPVVGVPEAYEVEPMPEEIAPAPAVVEEAPAEIPPEPVEEAAPPAEETEVVEEQIAEPEPTQEETAEPEAEGEPKAEGE
jgi:hypothetical protein